MTLTQKKRAVLFAIIVLAHPSVLHADPVKDDRAKLLFASLDRQSVRTYGARLEASAALAKRGSKHTLQIKWSLDYDGPRQPLIILRPSLTEMTGGQTQIEFFLVPMDNDLRRFYISAPHAPGLPSSNPKWMITVKAGDTAKGSIEVPLDKIREAFARQCVGDFDKRKSLHFQLNHKPTDRLMDAWTGSLFSKVLVVPEPK